MYASNAKCLVPRLRPRQPPADELRRGDAKVICIRLAATI